MVLVAGGGSISSQTHVDAELFDPHAAQWRIHRSQSVDMTGRCGLTATAGGAFLVNHHRSFFFDARIDAWQQRAVQDAGVRDGALLVRVRVL